LKATGDGRYEGTAEGYPGIVMEFSEDTKPKPREKGNFRGNAVLLLGAGTLFAISIMARGFSAVLDQ